MAGITHLLLDCDGVLVNSETLAQDAELSVLSNVGLELSESEYSNLTVGYSEKAHLALIADALESAGIQIDLSKLKQRLRAARWERYESDLRQVPALAEISRKYRDRVAVVTSSDADSVTRKLELAGLHMINRDRVFATEPSDSDKADVFHRAMSALGTTGDQCLAIEDSEQGVRAALTAGAEVWGFTEETPAPPDQVESSLRAAGASRVFGDGNSLLRAIETLFE